MEGIRKTWSVPYFAEEIAIPADADTGVVLFSATLSREKVAEVLRPLVGVG